MPPVSRIVLAVIAGMLLVGCGSGGPGGGDTEAIPTDGWNPSRAVPAPSGGQVAFLGSRPDEFRKKVLLTSDEPRNLGPPGLGAARGFAWMPDGRSLVMTYGLDLDSTVPNRLAVVDLSGRTLQDRPLDHPLYGASGIAVSPDGRSVLLSAQTPSPYDENTDLWEIDLASGSMVNLTNTADVGEHSPAYLKDGRILFSAGAVISESQGPNGWVGVIDRASGHVTRLTPESQTVDTVTVDPSGRYAVYDAFPGNSRQERALWTVAVSGVGQPQELVRLESTFPSLSPDGRRILVFRPAPPFGAGKLVWVAVPEAAPWLQPSP